MRKHITMRKKTNKNKQAQRIYTQKKQMLKRKKNSIKNQKPINTRKENDEKYYMKLFHHKKILCSLYCLFILFC